MMYGMPPPEDSIRPFEPIQPFPVPAPAAPYVPLVQQQPYVQAPDTAEGLVERTKHRIAWLENELRMHEAWKRELEVLRKMLAAYDESPRTGHEGGGA